MKTYKKNYIGKGTQHETLNIVRVTLPVEEVLKYKHEFNGADYITFELAQLQTPDKFGRTHTAYVTTTETAPETAEEPKPAARKGRKPKRQTCTGLNKSPQQRGFFWSFQLIALPGHLNLKGVFSPC